MTDYTKELELNDLSSIFLKKEDQAVFDYIYSVLEDNGVLKDEDGTNENFYTKFHNLYYLVDSIVLGEQYSCDLPYEFGISMDICNHYLVKRERLERLQIDLDWSVELRDQRIKRTVDITWAQNTSALAVVFHTLRAHNCDFSNHREMSELVEKINPKKYGKLFTQNEPFEAVESLYDICSVTNSEFQLNT